MLRCGMFCVAPAGHPCESTFSTPFCSHLPRAAHAPTPPSHSPRKLHTRPVLLARSCHCSRRPCAVVHAVCCHATKARNLLAGGQSHCSTGGAAPRVYCQTLFMDTAFQHAVCVVTWQSLFHVLVIPLLSESAQQGQEGHCCRRNTHHPGCDMPTEEQGAPAAKPNHFFLAPIRLSRFASLPAAAAPPSLPPALLAM